MTSVLSLFDPLFGNAPVDEVFSDGARIQAMLDFEAALARAEARVGIVPGAAALAIESCCRAELYDFAALGAAAARAGNLAIPLIKALTERTRAHDEAAAVFVHYGATSQDMIDTGAILQQRRAQEVMLGGLDALVRELAQQAVRERTTVMVGRTWLQQAVPITFGLKCAGWLDAILRARARLEELDPTFVVQCGGAAGTLASLGDRGLDVTRALADELGLASPLLPWHGARDRPAQCAAALGILIGTLGKLARDCSLMSQSEVGELAEGGGPGRGGSSTMPHKRNPVSASVILAAAARAPGLVATLMGSMTDEHERGLGNWQSEWTALPELWKLAGGALARALELAGNWQLDRARMRANLDLTRGLIYAEAVTMALAPHLGRPGAHARVEAACRLALEEGIELSAAIARDPMISAHLDDAARERLFDPAHYLGEATRFVDAVVEAAQAQRGRH